jgi:hypothetical protein
MYNMASLPAEKLSILNVETEWARGLLDQVEFANKEFTILQIEVKIGIREFNTSEQDRQEEVVA